MSDPGKKADLLESLALERTIRPLRPSGRFKWVIGFAVAVLIAASLVFLFWAAPSAISIRVASVTRMGSVQTSFLEASGYVIARRQATLSAKILGKLTDVAVEEGDQVGQGQVVARLDDSNYRAVLEQARAQALAARANVDQARVAFEDARPSYARYQALRSAEAISAEALDQQKGRYDTARTGLAAAIRNLGVAQAAIGVAQANEDDTVVRAPFGGIVTDKAAQPGEIVAPAAAGGGFTRTGIATIVDMNSLEVEVDVAETSIDRVHFGQKCFVRLNAYPERDLSGSVAAIVPTADQNKGSVKVRIQIGAHGPGILPQMGARVSFISTQIGAMAQVRVPDDAVIKEPVPTVFVINRQGTRVFARRVTIRISKSGYAEIGSGLKPGDRVAISRLSDLRDGALITIEE